MANIRVRVGQRQGTKVIASNKAAANSIGAATDVDTTARGNYSVLMYDTVTSKYIHVPASQVVDMADGVDDDAYDGGIW